MKILLAVDVQPEFAKDSKGKELYDKLISYLNQPDKPYDKVIAFVYSNSGNKNMRRLVHWDEMEETKDLAFDPDAFHFHAGYCPVSMPKFSEEDEVDIIGFDTDACVMSTAFYLFNDDVMFHVLEDCVYSSGGEEMHELGLKLMRRQFGDALVKKGIFDEI